jgi:hypothetical protein
MGPFKMLACPAPSKYRLDVPATRCVFPESNVERLCPYLRGPAAAGDPAAPAVQELLKFWMRYGGPHVVRWAGRDAPGDTWEPLERPTNCEAALIDFEQATGRTLPRPAPPPPAAASADRFHRRRGSAGGPGGGARGPAAALLVARRWLAARHRRPPLPARRVLARGRTETTTVLVAGNSCQPSGFLVGYEFMV